MNAGVVKPGQKDSAKVVEIEQRWPGWLARLITQRLTLADFRGALHPLPDAIKTVIEIP